MFAKEKRKDYEGRNILQNTRTRCLTTNHMNCYFNVKCQQEIFMHQQEIFIFVPLVLVLCP